MQPLVSLEWAKDYFASSRPKADEWDTAEDVDRQRYLGWASVLIKSAFVFQDGIDIGDDDRVRIAACEQALWLMRRTDEYPDVLTKGIVNAAVGNGAASATFSKDFIAPLICEEAKLAVSEIGHFIRGVGIVKTMPLGGIWSNPSNQKLPIGSPPCGGNKYAPMTQDEVESLMIRVFNQ